MLTRVGYSVDIFYCDFLTFVDFPALTYIGGAFQVAKNVHLNSISYPVLATIGQYGPKFWAVAFCHNSPTLSYDTSVLSLPGSNTICNVPCPVGATCAKHCQDAACSAISFN